MKQTIVGWSVRLVPGGPVPWAGACVPLIPLQPQTAFSLLTVLQLTFSPFSQLHGHVTCATAFGLTLYCHLEILTFWTRGLDYHFVLVLANDVAGLPLSHLVPIVPSARNTLPRYSSLADLLFRAQLRCHSSEKQSKLDPCALLSLHLYFSLRAFTLCKCSIYFNCVIISSKTSSPPDWAPWGDTLCICSWMAMPATLYIINTYLWNEWVNGWFLKMQRRDEFFFPC